MKLDFLDSFADVEQLCCSFFGRNNLGFQKLSYFGSLLDNHSWEFYTLCFVGVFSSDLLYNPPRGVPAGTLLVWGRAVVLFNARAGLLRGCVFERYRACETKTAKSLSNLSLLQCHSVQLC